MGIVEGTLGGMAIGGGIGTLWGKTAIELSEAARNVPNPVTDPGEGAAILCASGAALGGTIGGVIAATRLDHLQKHQQDNEQ